MLNKVLLATSFALGVRAQSSEITSAATSIISTLSSSASAAASLPSSASSIASSTVSTTSPAPSGAGQTLLSALSSNVNSSTFAAAINASSPLLNLTSALSDPSRQLTVFVPPSAALQAAASSPLVNAVRVNVSATESVTLLDALLALHVVNGSYPSEAIRSAVTAGAQPGMSSNAISVGSVLSGFNVTVYGFFAANSSAGTASASASSGSISASASSSASMTMPSAVATGSNTSDVIFVNNALVTGPNAMTVGGSVIHEISNLLDPFLPLVGLTDTQLSATQNATYANGFVVTPSWYNEAANATVVPVSSSSAAPSSASSAAVSSAASSSVAVPSTSGFLQPIGPVGASLSGVNGVPSNTATATVARYKREY